MIKCKAMKSITLTRLNFGDFNFNNDTYICTCQLFLQIGLAKSVGVLLLHLGCTGELRVRLSLRLMVRCLLLLMRHVAELAISKIVAGIILLILRGSRGTRPGFRLAGGVHGIRPLWAAALRRLLMRINAVRSRLQGRIIFDVVLLLLRVLVLGVHHPLLVQVVALHLGIVHLGGLGMAHHLLLVLSLLADVHIVSVVCEVISASPSHTVDPLSILTSDLMVLHLLNYLLHVLTCVLKLCELLLEPQVERLQRDDFLG